MAAPAESVEKASLLAVLQFLRKKNLKSAEEALRKEAGLDAVSAEAKSGGGIEADLSSVLSEYESDGDPLRYEEYYRGLQDFVEKSLDAYKHELALVLYPVFVHLYLEFVYKGYEAEAQRFYDKFCVYQDSYRLEDLEKLCTLKKKEHIQANNELLSLFRSSKYVIKMSRESFNLLKKYLQDNQIDVLLNLIQQHFHLDVFDGRPRSKRAINATTGFLTGEAPADANKTKVLYGLMHEPELMAALADDTGDSEEEGEAQADKDKDKPKKKKTKKDDAKKRQASDPNAPKSDRIPFPKMKDSEKRYKLARLKEISKRLHVGPDKIPSVCFYTLLHAQGLNAVDISEDSSMLACGFEDATVKVWSLTAKKLRTLKTTAELARIDKEADDVLERIMNDKTASESKTLYGHAGPVYGLSFSDDKSFMVSASEDGSVRLWSLHTFSNLVCYKVHLYPVWDVKFCPRGYYFASASYDRTVRLWTTDSHQPVRVFAGHLSDVNVVDFHPNCNYVATGSADRTVRVWDILTGNTVRLFTGHKASVQTVMFSPDGRHLVSAGVDNRILVWDIAEATPLADLNSHTSTVNSLSFSREGHVLASGGLDSCVKLWDMKTACHIDDDDASDMSGSAPSQSAYEMASFVTKSTPVHHLHFTRRNLLLAAGPFEPVT